jgi:hypothetical protein
VTRKPRISIATMKVVCINYNSNFFFLINYSSG